MLLFLDQDCMGLGHVKSGFSGRFVLFAQGFDVRVFFLGDLADVFLPDYCQGQIQRCFDGNLHYQFVFQIENYRIEQHVDDLMPWNELG